MDQYGVAIGVAVVRKRVLENKKKGSQLQVSLSILVSSVTFNPCLCVTLNPRLSQLQVSPKILVTVSLSILVWYGVPLNPRL